MNIFEEIYQAIVKSYKPPEEYIVDAATLKCEHGTIMTLLYIPPATSADKIENPTLITDEMQAREVNAEVPKNIKPFGDCKKMDCKSCRKFIAISGQKWQGTNEEHLINGKPSVTMQSFLQCEIGGKITPLDSGQGNVHRFDQELEELDDVIRQYEVRIAMKNMKWFIEYNQEYRKFWTGRDKSVSSNQGKFRAKEKDFFDKHGKVNIEPDLREMIAEINQLPIVQKHKDAGLAYVNTRFVQMVNTNKPMDFKSRVYRGGHEGAKTYEAIEAEMTDLHLSASDPKAVASYIENTVGMENVNFDSWSIWARPYQNMCGVGQDDRPLERDDIGNIVFGAVGAEYFYKEGRNEVIPNGTWLKYGAGGAQFASNMSGAKDAAKNELEARPELTKVEKILIENIVGPHLSIFKMTQEISRYSGSILSGEYGDSRDANGSDSDVVQAGIEMWGKGKKVEWASEAAERKQMEQINASLAKTLADLSDR